MTNKRITGIYGYFDTLKYKIIYIGKDSNIEKKVRHKQHYSPSLYNAQKINQVLQNDKIGRYSYVEFDKGYYNDDTLNEKEIYWISYFDPLFNFTKGGDGISGYEFTDEHRKKISESMRGKCTGEKNHNWKPEARVVKRAFTSYGKQLYVLYYKGKEIKSSIYKDKLDELEKKLNDGVITVKEIKEKKHSNWKPEARVIKWGFDKVGRQKYTLKYEGKTIKSSINKEKLLEEANKLNEGIITVEEIEETKHKKDEARVMKNGINKNGKQIYVLRYEGKNIKSSINKEKLQKIADEINIRGGINIFEKNMRKILCPYCDNDIFIKILSTGEYVCEYCGHIYDSEHFKPGCKSQYYD